MGTRHLICIYWQGKWYLAQYGQWDGYPRAQGVAILEFLSNSENVKNLKYGLEHCVHQVSAEELDAYAARKPPPSLDRTTSAKLLSIIASAGAEALQRHDESSDQAVDVADKIPLFLELKFVLDSIYCEWAYVIDLDTECLEVYSGPDQKKTDSHRFKSLGGPQDFVPTLVASFGFEDLRKMTEEEFANRFEGMETSRVGRFVTYDEEGNMILNLKGYI